uniref:Kinesin motor domain-containing protein n=1 Tax=Anguilla anguilla TaxID=7936 RepID=A0A0E9SKT1_ANGAN
MSMIYFSLHTQVIPVRSGRIGEMRKDAEQRRPLERAGNINTSLLILGKCINALRHNQQSK